MADGERIEYTKRQVVAIATGRLDPAKLNQQLGTPRRKAAAKVYRYPITDASGKVIAYDLHPPEYYTA